jgi:flagellar biosynthesis component FlhA
MVKTQLVIPIAVILILVAVLVPLPSFIPDTLISANIALSVVILLSSVYVLNPSQFSSFPSILLLTTLFRLTLNISSTRLILLNGSTGLSAAGDALRAFGQFVVGGNFAVGIVVFLVLIIIQGRAINHGAVRISDVTARFTLAAPAVEHLIYVLTQACQRSLAQWTLLCSSALRVHVRKPIERFMPQLSVISPNDISPNIQIVSLGVAGQ